MVNKKDIEEIAEAVGLKLQTEELERLTQELSEVLEYFSGIKKLQLEDDGSPDILMEEESLREDCVDKAKKFNGNKKKNKWCLPSRFRKE